VTTQEEVVEKLEKARKALEKTQNQAWNAEEEFNEANRRWKSADSTNRLMKLGVEEGVQEVLFWERVLRELEK
jgi:hypothetical protein